MQTVSQLYETIRAGLRRVEVRVRIDRENYPSGYWYLQTNTGAAILTDDNENIEVTPFPAANLTEGTLFGVTITGGLYSSQTFAIGSCVSREIEVRFLLGNAEIPRMAMIQPEVRLVNDAGDVSEWIPKGTFWLDTRELDKETGIMTVRGYDAMLKGEADYIASGVVGDWPKTMSSVASEIAGLMGLTMDSRNTINSTYMMNLPAGYSMREILGYIAAANCGNWIVTDEGKLRLVRVNDTVDNEDLGLAAMTYHIGEPYQAFSKVELNLSENLYVEAGTDTGRTLVADCPIVTTTTGETIAAAVLSALSGFIYTPLTADGAILDPAMEIGDTVTVGTTTSVIATQTMRLDSLCASDISAPGEDELDHEYPYQSVGQRKIERKISTIETTFRVEADAIIGRIEDLSETSIASVVVEYAIGTSDTTAPSTGWSTTSPQWEEGKYIWQRTVTTFADSTAQNPHVVTSSPVCIQGAMGEDGVGITSIVPEYYLSTSASTQTGGSWSTTAPAWTSGKYLWVRSHIYWDNGTNTTTTPQLDNAINDLGSKYSQIKQTLDSISLTVSNGSTSSTITLSATGIATQSINITFTGMVTFASLNDPTSTSGGSVTYIDGAHIKTGTIAADRVDVSTLRVQEVWYYDTFNTYRMLRSIVSGVNTYTDIGPEQINNGYAQVLNCYGTQIYFKAPGASYSSVSGSDVLCVDMANHVISSYWSWNLGSFNDPWNRVICTRLHLWVSSSEYGDLYVDSDGNLVYMDFVGHRYYICGPTV